MAGSASNWLEDAVLNGTFRAPALPRVTTLYQALYTTDPTDADVGVEVSAVGTGYVRQPITVADASWLAPATVPGTTDQRVSNVSPVTYATPGADYSAAYWGLRDHPTAGNLWFHGDILGGAVALSAGEDPFVFDPGAISITWTGRFSAHLKAAILNNLLRTTLWVKPGNIWFALHSADPEAGGPELTGGGYGRAALATADASWSAPITSGTDREIANALVIAFPVVTGPQGTYTHFAARDAQIGGNLLLSEALAVSRAVNLGNNPPQWPAGTLRIQHG